MQVRERMSAPALTVRADSDYRGAMALMEDNAVHHLPVVAPDGGLVGMITERDLLVAATHYLNSGIEVGDVMHRGVVTARPDMNMAAAAGIMAMRRIGSLPVMDNSGCLVGIITESDVLKAFAEVA